MGASGVSAVGGRPYSMVWPTMIRAVLTVVEVEANIDHYGYNDEPPPVIAYRIRAVGHSDLKLELCWPSTTDAPTAGSQIVVTIDRPDA